MGNRILSVAYMYKHVTYFLLRHRKKKTFVRKICVPLASLIILSTITTYQLQLKNTHPCCSNSYAENLRWLLYPSPSVTPAKAVAHVCYMPKKNPPQKNKKKLPIHLQLTFIPRLEKEPPAYIHPGHCRNYGG